MSLKLELVKGAVVASVGALPTGIVARFGGGGAAESVNWDGVGGNGSRDMIEAVL